MKKEATIQTEVIMRVITQAQLNELIASLARKYNKTQHEIRDLLTPEKLAKLGYRAENLVEQLQREGVFARENMIINNLQSKGLI